MFTGIITGVGRIAAAEQRGDLRLRIACGYDPAGIDLGASIACSGVCLTVVDKGVEEGKGSGEGEGESAWFAVDVSAETSQRTAPGMWAKGARLNLERALRLGDELGGHIVTGHVDGVGSVVSVEPSGDSSLVVIAAPAALAPYIAAKGSVAIDGASLTVNIVEADPADAGGVRFAINIIPHTAAATNFGGIAAGRAVNIEIDVLARYIGRMLELRG